MRYYATTQSGRERVVDIEPAGEGRYEVTIDGAGRTFIDAARLEGTTLHLLVDGCSREAEVVDDEGAVRVRLGDVERSIVLVDERRRRLASVGGGPAASGRVLLKAPMPGKVVKLLVSVGDAVAEGQGVLLIEAMKMENELRSPKAGRVLSIAVAEGQTVEGRAELLVIE
jgi:biotin carboxyl carrier protein